jgi:hypothetical protein
MHGSQLQLGSTLCCGHVTNTEKFHHPENQVLFKKFDISCALLACMAAITCHDSLQLLTAAIIALPSFIAGLYFKRIDWHRAYLFSHGLWHIAMCFPILFKFI